MYKLAVNHDGFAIRYITCPLTEDICVLAVQQNGLALQFINDEFQTQNICNLAVFQNSSALQYVSDRFKTKDIYDLANQ